MEIDFLGLNFPKYGMEQHCSMNPSTDTAKEGVETFLSLSTSSSLGSEIRNFSEKKKIRWGEFHCDKMTNPSDSSGHYSHESPSRTEQPGLVLASTPVFLPSSATTTGFPYDLNDDPIDIRNISELPSDAASLTMPYSGRLPEEAEKAMYTAGNASPARLSGDARIRTSGYTPTVAMARRATLARFLEKRLHRMNKVRTSHLMGKSLNPIDSEACSSSPTAIRRSNKKRNNTYIRL